MWRGDYFIKFLNLLFLEKGTHSLSLSLTYSQPIPLFVLSLRHSQSPDALRIPGLVDVVHRAEVDLEPPPSPPPGSWRLPPAGGMRPRGFSHWWLTSWTGFWFRPGDVHFSQDHCRPLILYPIALPWSEQAEIASIQQEQTTNKKLVPTAVS